MSKPSKYPMLSVTHHLLHFSNADESMTLYLLIYEETKKYERMF
jgi:hypothetical protein